MMQLPNADPSQGQWKVKVVFGISYHSLLLYSNEWLAYLFYNFTFVLVEKRKNLMKKDLRRNLFYLFAAWSGKFGRPIETNPGKSVSKEDSPTSAITNDFEFSSLQVRNIDPCNSVSDGDATSDLRSFQYHVVKPTFATLPVDHKVSLTPLMALTALLGFHFV